MPFDYEFIMQTALISLGLTIALYTIFLQSIESRVKRKIEKKSQALTAITKDLEVAISELNKDSTNKEASNKITALQEEFRRVTQPNFLQGDGFLYAIILFSITLIYPLLDMAGAINSFLGGFFKLPVGFVQLALIVGLSLFVAICIFNFADFRSYINATYQDKIDELKQVIDKNKKEKRIK